MMAMAFILGFDRADPKSGLYAKKLMVVSQLSQLAISFNRSKAGTLPIDVLTLYNCHVLVTPLIAMWLGWIIIICSIHNYVMS